MNELIYLAKEHRRAVLIVALIIAAAFALGAVRCVAYHDGLRQAQEAEETEQAKPAEELEKAAADASGEQGESEADDGEHAFDKLEMTEEELAAIEFTDVVDMRAEYSEDTLSLIALLSSNVWTANEQRYSLTFTDVDYAETDADTVEQTPYVITAMKNSDETLEDGATMTVTTFAFATPDETTIATLSVTSSTEDINLFDAELEIDQLAFSNVYQLDHAADFLEVDNPPDEWCEGHDVTAEELAHQLSEYCSRHYPTATTATWTQIATEDFGNGVTTIEYVLDNRGNNTVALTISMDDGSVGIEV